MKLKRQNLGNFAHATNREETHVFCLEKQSFHIYDESEISKNEKMRAITIDHIPMLVQNLNDKGMMRQLTSIDKMVVHLQGRP